jgi:hypothetical protein
MGQAISHTSVYPFIYQSNSLNFSEWITVLTLSLAPFIAHIAGGVPQHSALSHNPVQWHDVLCHYNPTSILWRYAAITDRRIRARKWSKIDMAASNALFWTHRGWDGSEAMVIASLPYCTSLPEHSRAELLSSETLKTTIIMLQSLQALFVLGSGIRSSAIITSLDYQDGVDSIFFPMAVFGFFRIVAAGWLTHNYSYTARDTIWMELATHFADPLAEPLAERPERADMARIEIDRDLATDRFKPTSYWPSVLFRGIYLALLLGVWVLALFQATPLLGSIWIKSVTTLLEGVFYFFFMTATCVIFLWHLFREGSRSTIIPCISRPWYRLYTIILWGFMLVMFIIACCETRRMPCGRYTSLATKHWPPQGDCIS